MIYDVLEMTVIEYHSYFTDTLWQLVLQTLLWNYIPIFIVLYIHFRNVVSINRILKMVLFRKQ